MQRFLSKSGRTAAQTDTNQTPETDRNEQYNTKYYKLAPRHKGSEDLDRFTNKHCPFAEDCGLYEVPNMRLNMTLNEFGNVCLMLIFGTFYYIPVFMPNTASAPTVQSQINQSHSASHIVLLAAWGGICYFLLKSRFQVRLDLQAARVALAYASFVALSIAWSTNPLSAVASSIQVILSTLYALYLVSKFPGERLLVMLSWVVMILAVASALFVIGLPQYGVDHFDNAGAWQGVFAQKNSLSVVMVYGIAIGLTFKAENLVHSMWKYGLLFLCLLEAARSQSREAWVILTLLLMIHAGFKLYRRLTLDSRGTALLIGAISAVVTGTLVAVSWESILKMLGRDASLRGRSQLWAAVLEQCKYHPVLGNGIGQFWGTPAAFRIYLTVSWNPTSAHDGFLETLLMFGAVGLGLLLFLMFIAYNNALKIIMNHPSFESSQLWIYCLFTITVFNVVQNTTGIPESLSWLLLVVSASILEGNRRAGVLALGSELATDPALLTPFTVAHRI
jgi:exopolysaccharide production protein ExoQ